MKKSAKAVLDSLYKSFVEPGIEEWEHEANVHDHDKAFLMWAVDLVLDELELTHEEVIKACRLDGKWDLNIDAGHVDEEEKRVYLIQGKRREPSKLLEDSVLFETWTALELLSNEAYLRKANSYTKDFYIDFSDAVKHGYQLVLCVATSGRISDESKAWVAGKPKKCEITVSANTYEVPVEFRAYDLEQLVEVARQGEEQPIVDSHPVSLTLPQQYYLSPPNATGGKLYDSLYATVSVEELLKVRKNRGPNIYRLNFRGPLGDKIAVNKDILSTVEAMPQMFHVLNNGLVAICDYFNFDEKENTLQSHGLQIVNGCQTLETLYKHSTQVTGRGILVNLRLVTCEPSQAALVARATNNQTRLKAEDFATLDALHDKLQSQFAQLRPHPWYYEIKRRYWKNVVSKEKSERGKYEDRVITLRDAAQRSLAFLGEPAVAHDRTKLIFTSESGGFKDKVFPKGLQAQQLLLSWLVYQQVDNSTEDVLTKIGSLQERDKAREYLEYGRLTAVSLVGDAIRACYAFSLHQYPTVEQTKKLIEGVEKWLPTLANYALEYIWQVAKTDKWSNVGARAAFRRSTTYREDLSPGFILAVKMSRPAGPLGLLPD